MVIKILGKIHKWLSSKNVAVSYQTRINDMKTRGLILGENVLISPGAKIDFNYPYLISIGDNCVIGPSTHILAHDSTMALMVDNYMRIGRVEIGNNCIICMNSVILPGVKIGDNVLVASGSVVNKDIPSNSCVSGVPARFYSKFDDFISNIYKDIEVRPVFEAVDLTRNEDDKDIERKKRIIEATKDGFVYIKGIESKYPIWLPKKSK